MPVPDGVITSTDIWKAEEVVEEVKEVEEEFTLDEEVIEE